MIPAITEVNFPSYATLHQATVSLQDMGDRVISTQVRIDGDVVPDFSGWELRFKGERFVLPSDNPQAMKDNTTRNSLVDLQFQSWAIQELKRYYFFEAASVSAGVAIADKYVAPVRLNVEDFVAMLNDVLDYYFDGKIVADLYLSGTGIYSQEKKDMEINYSYLWEVIGKVFEVYGVRNVIEYDSTNDVYTIKFGYPADEIDDHTFEYGYQGGLLKFERQVQDETISNILLGRGGEKNLPYRYFKAIDPQNPEWAADPDAIPELANIYFDRLRDINFRRYVQGWRTNPNRDTSWEAVQTYDAARGATDWAYKKGHEDEKFSPVEYVKDDESIAAYGEHWGALDDNDEIYPTIQGRSRTGLGRIDEVVAVSPIITDDIQAMAQASAVEKSISSLTVSKYGSTETTHTIESEEFTIPDGSTGNITYAWVDKATLYAGNVYCDTVNSSLVAVSSANGTELPISGIPAGTYRLRLRLVIRIDSPATSATGTFGIENIVLTTSAQDDEAWKPTFDIWVKDIWGIAREQGESDVQYAMRVWGPILGDRVGNEAKVVFSTGFMSVSEDYEFTIAGYPVPDTTKTLNGVPSAWRITLRKSDAEYDATGLYIPNNSTGGKPIAGDKFFFTGIDMPHLYVTLAEEELNTFKSAQLQGTSAVNPTWVISLDKVRVHTLEDGEYGQTLAERLAAGAKLRVTDPRFSGGDILTLYAQSVTYTWNEPSDGSPYLVPDIEVVLSDQVVSRESRVDKIQSSVEQIKSQYARIDDVESVVRKVAEPMFLKKTGEADSSESPTQFSSKVTSRGFRQGGIGGTGWGFYRDNTEQFQESGTPVATRSRSTRAVSTEIEEGDSVLEVDRVVVRKEMKVNSLVVNQVEYRGGMEIISAAKIEISKVIDDDANGVYICYFDQRQNSVANNFQVGDVAYGHVFTPNDSTLRYYKCRVVGVDVDRIMLSKTVKDGAGVPQAGDVVVQFGSYTNSARRYVIVRDVVGGGYEQMLSGLDSVTASGEEYYYAGRTTGQNPRWFVGDSDGEYAEWENGQLNIKGSILVRNGSTYSDLSGALADLDYLTTALPESSTLIQGGLILSKVIALTDAQNNIKSGINGVPSLSNIAAWYGGPMADKDDAPTPQDYAKSLFRFDGSGYLAGGNIHWDSQGYGGIPGITWSNDGTNDVVTIGGNVKLASVSGDSVTDMLNTVNSIKDWFEEVNLGTDQNPAWALRLKKKNGELSRAFVTYGDQIVEDGTPGGGGGGGVDHLYKLEDVYGDYTTERVKTAAGATVSDGQALVWNENLSKWVAGTVQSGGGSVTSVGLSMPTGFSVSGSPVTSSGTLAVSFASGYSLPTTAKQSNWDTAYGWGNHANAGYLLASTASSTYQPIISDLGTIRSGASAGATAVQPGSVKTLTVQLNGTTVGSAYNPVGSSNQTVNITKSSLSSLLNDTFHPYGGSTTLTTFNIGGATLTWHPESSDGAGDAYLELNSAFVTSGDQIVGGGTPGGGGGGGAQYLTDLLDVYPSTKPSAQKILVFDPNQNDKDGNPGAWVYANMPSGSVTSVVGETGDVTAAQISTAIGLGDYLPKSGGTLTNELFYPLTLKNDASDATSVGIRFRVNDAEVGTLYVSTGNKLMFYDETGYRTVYHSGNTSISSSAVTIGTDTVGSSAAPIGYATQATRLKRYEGTAAADGYDLNTMLSGGGITSQYNSGTYWANGPTGMSYGGVAQFNTQSTNTLSLQLAWDVTHNVEDGTKSLWWRDRNNLGWGGWRLIYHSGNFIAGTNYVAPQTTLAGYGITDWVVMATGTALDSLTTAGVYRLSTQTSPYGTYGNLLVVRNGSSSDTLAQVYFPYNSDRIYFRRGATSNFTSNAWQQLYHTGNFNPGDYLPLAGGTMTGGIKMSYTSNSGANFRFINNRAVSGGGGWADSVLSIYTAAESSLATIGIYGSADSLTYLYIGSNGYSGLNLRINSSSIKWGDDNILHAGNYASYALPLSAGSSYPLTGDLYITAGKGIQATGSKGLLVYHPATDTWTGVSNTQWAVGVGDSQGVIRSNNNNLLHYRNGTTYDIWDKYNAGTSTTAWTCSTLTTNGIITISGIGGAAITQKKGTGTVFSLGSGSSATTAGTEYGVLNLYHNGSELIRLYANSSNPSWINAGNVGIGTTSPSYKLHVNGTIASVCSGGGSIRIGEPGNSNSSAGEIFFQNGVRNGFKIAAVYAAYAARQNLVFYRSNVTADPYAWTPVEIFKLSYDGVATVTGTFVSTGDQVISSDINLKTNLAPVTYSVEDIAKTRAVTFDWKDGRGHSAGSIAQDWKPLIPELVHGEEGNMTLAYGQIALVNTILLAKHETEQDKEIKRLKARVKELEKQLKIRS